MSKKCINAYKTVRFSNSGHAYLCCKSDNMLRDYDGELCSIDRHNMLEVLNSKDAVEIREALARGEEHPNCIKCWEEERAGIVSKRMLDYEQAIKKWGKEYADSEDVDAGLLEINLGTLCNLKCRICGPWASSRWNGEYIEKQPTAEREHTKEQLKIWAGEGRYEEDSKTWENLEVILPHVKEIDMYGGEPFMIQQQWDMLQKSVDLGFSVEQILHFNTNGTHYDEHNIELLKNFKEVEISISIDGVGKEFEYQRHLAKWDLVYENLKKFKKLSMEFPHIKVQICITMNILNVWNFYEYVKTFKSIGMNYYVNILHYGEHYCIQSLLERAKEEVLKKYENIMIVDSEITDYDKENMQRILQFMFGKISTRENWQNFLDETKRADEYRNEDFSSVYEEFSKVIAYEKS